MASLSGFAASVKKWISSWWIFFELSLEHDHGQDKKKEDIDIKMRWSPELVHHHLDKVVLIYSPDTLILVMHAEKYVLDVVKVTG